MLCDAKRFLGNPNKSGGDLDLYYKDRALLTWTLVKGHKGPVKGLRASGPQGPDPYSYS
jgi:hypothetical protein